VADFKPLNLREWISFILWDIRGKSSEWWALHRPLPPSPFDEQWISKIVGEISTEAVNAAVDGVAEIMAREVQQAQIVYYNAGHLAGLHEGWNAAKAGEVFPAADGPVRAEARRIIEARQPDLPPITKAELEAEIKARLAVIVSKKMMDRTWSTMRAEHPEKTKGPGRPKKTAPISK